VAVLASQAHVAMNISGQESRGHRRIGYPFGGEVTIDTTGFTGKGRIIKYNRNSQYRYDQVSHLIPPEPGNRLR
jgi:hypothetical protein